MVHYYIGNGKGKTTAALGLALRASGWGKSVYIAQFLKDKNLKSGEIEALKKAGLNIKIERFNDQIHPIFLNKREVNARKTKSSVRTSLKNIAEFLKKSEYDLIILDEIFSILSSGFTTIRDLSELIKKAGNVELVLTGRTCPPSLFKKADYISFVKDIKHPFRKGIKARRGVEY